MEEVWMKLKSAIFMRATKSIIRCFAQHARKEIGWQLRAVQAGEEPADWKQIPSVGLGVKEIRIHHPHEHRVLYVAHYPEAVYVLHAFQKKTQTTPQRHIDLARAAYAEVQTLRQQKR
jgi:phage-related protein